MTTRINALLLDDNKTIAECIVRRIFKASDSNLPFTNLDVVPHFLPLQLADLDQCAAAIGDALILKEIDILLLDRGFYSLIDPTDDNVSVGLDRGSLYIRKDDAGIKIEQILTRVAKEKFNKLKGVIVYTYDDENQLEPAQIRELIRQVLPSGFDKDAIDVVLTYPEIYELAGLTLYQMKSVAAAPKLRLMGGKSDFMLYGLFMGEILYHRTLALVTKLRAKRLRAKGNQALRNILLLFGVFTALNLGAASLYSLLTRSGSGDLVLMIICLIFAVVLPLLILRLKPEWIISLDD